jgi:hypothetical protein
MANPGSQSPLRRHLIELRSKANTLASLANELERDAGELLADDEETVRRVRAALEREARAAVQTPHPPAAAQTPPRVPAGETIKPGTHHGQRYL